MTGCIKLRQQFALCALAAIVALSAAVMLAVDCVWGGESAPSSADDLDWAKEREFWSFRAPQVHRQPVVKNQRWPRQPVDYFILAGLEAKRLAPSPEANKRTLIRRVTFDLIDLPPTPEEAAAFLADKRTDAYERLVDRLLASPRFGERMASIWLPLARYGEDQAHQVGSDTKYFYPNAWRYREWIINAFNRDLPYDQFVKLQLAADKLEGTNSPNLAALGFLGLGPKYYNRDRLDVQADEWEDRIDTVSRTFLGLTVACARCHDHKFDPITTRDYYAMAGVFASTRMINRKPDGAAEKGEAQQTNMAPATLHVVQDSDSVQDLPVFRRGNVERKGPVAPRRFLRVLSPDEPPPFKDGSGRTELAAAIANRDNPLTARVIVNRVWGDFFGKPLVATPSNFGHSGQPPTNPELLDDLAVRFMENEWSLKTLVRELVLSATYRQASDVKSLKGLNKLNASNGALRTQGDARPALNGLTIQSFNSSDTVAIDESNQWLSHMNRRRLSIEQWRDAVLFVSGQLDFIGGNSLELDDPVNYRRTVYARVSRLKLNDLLMQFDYPDANVHAEKRSVTTTAIQKLFVLNSPFMLERAKAFAARLAVNSKESDKTRVARAYEQLFGREPSREESKLALEFLRKPASGEMTRWEQYAQILLGSNEMLYVD